jgi:hypothetical protein
MKEKETSFHEEKNVVTDHHHEEQIKTKIRGRQESYGGILFGEEAIARAWAQSACSTSTLLACSLGAPPET